MRILFLCHGFNSLTQRLYAELAARGHEISVEFDIHDSVTEEAVALWRPEVILAPFLKRAIPSSVWRAHRCLVVHPGIPGDRGPSSLDRAIQEGESRWGVTVIEATGEMDAGAVWASQDFEMRAAAKGGIYRREVTEAAVRSVLIALERMEGGVFRPALPEPAAPGATGRFRPLMKQPERAIDWTRDSCETVLRRIRAADGAPGVLDSLCGQAVFLYDAHPEDSLSGGAPGTVIATRGGAILRATVDGAVWIGHLKIDSGEDPARGLPAIKLPATMVLGERLSAVPESVAPLWDESGMRSFRDIRYEEKNAVGVLHFCFYNGAMSTEQCRRLAEAIRFARSRPTRVIVLAGGADFWSNGIHLGVIEASAAPAEESWANINAIDDVALEILGCDRQLTLAALQGNAGAGGVFLALAADRVLARRGVVLNPHYRNMGNLYGSEYWTYTLPRRVGPEAAAAIMRNRLPLGAPQAAACGLIDGVLDLDAPAFLDRVAADAQALAGSSDFDSLLAGRQARRAADEVVKPLARYRTEELEHLRRNFHGFDPSYHVARYNFVFKVPRSRTPLYLAKHRATCDAGCDAGMASQSRIRQQV